MEHKQSQTPQHTCNASGVIKGGSRFNDVMAAVRGEFHAQHCEHVDREAQVVWDAALIAWRELPNGHEWSGGPSPGEPSSMARPIAEKLGLWSQTRTLAPASTPPGQIQQSYLQPLQQFAQNASLPLQLQQQQASTAVEVQPSYTQTFATPSFHLEEDFEKFLSAKNARSQPQKPHLQHSFIPGPPPMGIAATPHASYTPASQQKGLSSPITTPLNPQAANFKVKVAKSDASSQTSQKTSFVASMVSTSAITAPLKSSTQQSLSPVLPTKTLNCGEQINVKNQDRRLNELTARLDALDIYVAEIRGILRDHISRCNCSGGLLFGLGGSVEGSSTDDGGLSGLVEPRGTVEETREEDLGDLMTF